MDNSSDDDDGNFIIDGDELPLVKPCRYDLAFQYYETLRLYGGRANKIVLWFKIVTQGEFYETMLPRYYNVKSVIGKPQEKGRFSVGKKCDFIRDYARLFPLPDNLKRLDRIPMAKFKGAIIEGKVRTVERGFNQGKIAKPLQYSVIGEMCKVKEL